MQYNDIAPEMFAEIRENPIRSERIEELLYISSMFLITTMKQYEIPAETSPITLVLKEIEKEIGTPEQYVRDHYALAISDNDNDKVFAS